MRWRASSDRSNIEDLRGRTGGRGVQLGLGGIILLAALSWMTGTDFLGNVATVENTAPPGQAASSPQEEEQVEFVNTIAGDMQGIWQELLGARYQPTRVALFRDSVDSACGFAQAATGPFYCPADQKVYLDLGFFEELDRRFGAPGDFAQAYVIAHEVGHHVQHLLGYDRRLQGGGARAGADSASVQHELQADCFAGVWGHAASKSGRFEAGHVELDPGDAEEALRAAASIGDDRLQKMTTGHVAPDRFTHGTSAQRMQWFEAGMRSGDPRRCETGVVATQ